jgi:hypothetical protein
MLKATAAWCCGRPVLFDIVFQGGQSFPCRRESRFAVWIPACAGMTKNTNSLMPQRDSPQSI